MVSNYVNSDLDEIIRSVLSEPTDHVLVQNPNVKILGSIVEVASERQGELPNLQVLADSGVVKEVMDDFMIGSESADLIDQGDLFIRTHDEDENEGHSLCVLDDSVYSLITTKGEKAALASDDESFVEGIHSICSSEWGSAEEFSMRTPPITRVRETLEEDIGAEVLADFTAMLESVDSLRGDEIDEVLIALLAAANNDVLLYDISKWGEDVGLASKATFSRTKSLLGNNGIITTEKVPIDVGRPRLRLQLTESFDDVDVEEMVSVARDMILQA
jgi:hypothetical protein